MIYITCAWCDADVVLAALDSPSVACPDCCVTVEFSPEPDALARAA